MKYKSKKKETNKQTKLVLLVTCIGFPIVSDVVWPCCSLTYLEWQVCPDAGLWERQCWDCRGSPERRSQHTAGWLPRSQCCLLQRNHRQPAHHSNATERSTSRYPVLTFVLHSFPQWAFDTFLYKIYLVKFCEWIHEATLEDVFHVKQPWRVAIYCSSASCCSPRKWLSEEKVIQENSWVYVQRGVKKKRHERLVSLLSPNKDSGDIWKTDVLLAWTQKHVDKREDLVHTCSLDVLVHV